MIELHNYRFAMNMNPGYKNDIWVLKGLAIGHPNGNGEILVSTPISLDRENKVITTISGRQYQLVNAEGDENKILDEIKAVIERGGYSKH